MKLHQLLQDTGIQPEESVRDVEVTSITCDSRRVEAGCLFVCIVGTAVDGHRFAAQAEDAGAVAVVVQRDMGLKTQLHTEDTRAAWAQICANWFGRPADRLRMVGVTGTNGKTTTTELTAALLASQGMRVAACGNIGRPVSDVAAEALEKGEKLYDAAVIEVSSFQLELAEGFTPAAAALLNLESDHIDRYRGGFAGNCAGTGFSPNMDYYFRRPFNFLFTGQIVPALEGDC